MSRQNDMVRVRDAGGSEVAEPGRSRDLRQDLRSDLGHDLRSPDLCPDLRQDLRQGLRQDIRQDLKADLHYDLRHSLRHDLRRDLRPGLHRDLLQCLRHDLREDTRRARPEQRLATRTSSRQAPKSRRAAAPESGHSEADEWNECLVASDNRQRAQAATMRVATRTPSPDYFKFGESPSGARTKRVHSRQSPAATQARRTSICGRIRRGAVRASPGAGAPLDTPLVDRQSEGHR